MGSVLRTFLLLFYLSDATHVTHNHLFHSLKSSLKVDLCDNKEKPLSCQAPARDGDSVPHSYHHLSTVSLDAEISPSFRIPIGLYLKSTYVFRVLAQSSNSDTVSFSFKTEESLY